MRVSLDSIYLTGNSGIETVERAVIRDSVSWAKMWARLTGMHIIPEPIPEVGFDSNLVVVAASGTSGPSIRIDSAKLEGAKLKIYVRQTIREGACLGDLMIRYPAHAVRVRRAAESVIFVEDSTVSKCR
jgi:hypothetical protein